jgi:uncharacterized protein (TIGR02001 family)
MEMKLKQLSSLCLAASVLTAAPAMAWESEDGQHSTSGSVALSSDYMWRGSSQTDNEPAISGSLDYGHASGIYAGVWASNVDFAVGTDAAHLEADIYAGFSSEFGDTGIAYDLGAMRYIYPGTDGADWNEYYAALSYSLFSLKVSHTEDFGGSDEQATHYLLGFNYDLPYDVALHANYAFYDFDDIDAVFGTTPNNLDNPLQDYAIGVSKNIIGLDWDVTYYETLKEGKDATENNNAGSDNKADSRFVLTVSKSF